MGEVFVKLVLTPDRLLRASAYLLGVFLEWTATVPKKLYWHRESSINALYRYAYRPLDLPVAPCYPVKGTKSHVYSMRDLYN